MEKIFVFWSVCGFLDQDSLLGDQAKQVITHEQYLVIKASLSGVFFINVFITRNVVLIFRGFNFLINH